VLTAAASEKYRSADEDSQGRLRIVTPDGRTIASCFARLLAPRVARFRAKVSF
jgi:DNA-binding transcriptional LysR family regulator